MCIVYKFRGEKNKNIQSKIYWVSYEKNIITVNFLRN